MKQHSSNQTSRTTISKSINGASCVCVCEREIHELGLRVLYKIGLKMGNWGYLCECALICEEPQARICARPVSQYDLKS